MTWNILGRALGALLGTNGARAENDHAAATGRRRMLAGLGFAGAAVAAAPFVLAAGNARAVLRPDDPADGTGTERDVAGGDGTDLAQAPRDHRRGPPRSAPPRREPPRRGPPPRQPPPRRGPPPPQTRRYSRSELRRRCRRDRHFYRRNPAACYRARSAPSRRGTCIRVGPIEICD